MIQSLNNVNTNFANTSGSRFKSSLISLQLQSKPDSFASKSVSFGRWFPATHNIEPINKGIKMLQDAKTIVIAGHKDHDGDATGGPLGLFWMLEKAFPSKKIVILSGEETKNGFKIIDPDSEIKVLKSQEEIAQYLKPDLFVSVDVAEKKLFHQNVMPIMESATKRLKIDHHSFNKEAKPEDFYFGDLNIIDDKLESASQLIMQMAGPLGLVHPTELTVEPKIANALGLGFLTDSGVFAHARGADIFMDACDWIKSSGVKAYKDIRTNLFKKDISDYQLETDIRSKVQFSDDKKIAHLMLGQEFDNEAGMKFAKNALQNLKELNGVKHAFFVIERKDGTLKASMRSGSNIKHVAEKLGGGGHPNAPGINDIKDKTPKQLFDEILQGLQEVE